MNRAEKLLAVEKRAISLVRNSVVERALTRFIALVLEEVSVSRIAPLHVEIDAAIARADAAEAELAAAKKSLTPQDALALPDVAALVEAITPLAFTNFDTTQKAWECVRQERFGDWLDYSDIDTARAALAALKGGDA